MKAKIDLATRQNPKNFTQQLEQRNVNHMLAKNLVKIKPMVDTKMPVSYKSKQQRRIRHASQASGQQATAFDASTSLNQIQHSMDHQLAMYAGHDNSAAVQHPDFANTSLDQDNLHRFSLQMNTSGIQPYPAIQDAINNSALSNLNQQQQLTNPSKMGQWNARAQDSLMSTAPQQHPSGPQQSQPAQHHRLSKQERERRRQIEQDNSILLNKMMQIMKRKGNKEQGLVKLSKTSTAQANSTGGPARPRKNLAADDPQSQVFQMVGSSDEAHTSGYYLSDNSNPNLQRQVMLAPKLNQSTNIQPKTNERTSLGMVPVVYAGAHYSGKANSHNRLYPVLPVSNQSLGAAQRGQQQQQYLEQSISSVEGGGLGKKDRQRSQLVPMPRTPGTLNFSSRKKQIEKINHENMQMLKTLQQTKPTTSFEQWRRHAKQQIAYKKNISLAAPNSTSASNYGASSQGVAGGYFPISAVNQVTTEEQEKLMHEQQQHGPFRDFLRSKVKSGSLPTRSNFYVHKNGQGQNRRSKKAYSMNNFTAPTHPSQVDVRSRRTTGAKRSPAHQLMLRHQILQQEQEQARMAQFYQLQAQAQAQTQASAQVYQEPSEVAQKIESVINMFPQPTDEQLEQFKELQESNADLEPASTPGLMDAHTITNINVFKNEAVSDHQVENYNLELMRSQQNNQMVSQPIVDQIAMEQDRDVYAAAALDDRRVKTTLPGKRSRKNGATERPQQLVGQDQDDFPEKDPDFDMQAIQEPQSMDASMNSQSQVPQIIVRKQVPGQEFSTEPTNGCNPMLIPIQQEPALPNQRLFYPPQSAQYSVSIHAGPVEQQAPQVGQSSIQASPPFRSAMHVPKRSFYDYQYADGPNYQISFDQRSGQPIMSSMDAAMMNHKLIEMQQDIAKRKLDEDSLAHHNYQTLQEEQASTKKKTIRQILKAYQQNNAAYGTNHNVLNQLATNSKRLPLANRRDSRLRKAEDHSLEGSKSAPRQAVSTQNNNAAASFTGGRKLRAVHQPTPRVSSLAQKKQHPLTQPNKKKSAQPAKFTVIKPIAPKLASSSGNARKSGLNAVRPPVPQTEQDNERGGPAQVSPEVLRLQANRPDERQQRNRQRVYSPPAQSQSNEATEATKEAAAPASLAPEAKPDSPKATNEQTEEKRAEPIDPVPVVEKQEQPVPVMSGGPSPTISRPTKMVIHTEKQSDTSQDQRASSTIEEGIMGLKYLSNNQTNDSNQQQQQNTGKSAAIPCPSEQLTQGVHFVEEKDPEEATIPEVKETSPTPDERNQSRQEEQDAHKPSSKQEVSVDDEGVRKISSQMEVHSANLIEHRAHHFDSSNKNLTSDGKDGSKRVTHQDTQLGLTEPRHIQDNPIPVDVSDSAVSERNKHEEGALSKNGEVGNQVAQKAQVVVQSQETEGAGYSDFEDSDGEQAAVGSGIVETGEDQDEIEGDGDMEVDEDYKDFYEASDSAGETSLKVEKQAAPVVGQIAQLVKKTQQDEQSDYSDDIVPIEQINDSDEPALDYEGDFVEGTVSPNNGDQQVPQQQPGVAEKQLAQKVQDSGEDEYSDDDPDHQQLQPGVQNCLQPEEDSGDDYDMDPSEGDADDKRRVSLDSDQDAPENEFEQIKDDEYADEFE